MADLCHGKRRYRSKLEAVDTAARAISRKHDNPKSLRFYRCWICSDWHLTSKPIIPGRIRRDG